MLKVMIADDEERICKLIIALVDWEKMGMEVIGVAHDGLEAIEMATKERPEILITDIQMPGCSGLDLIEKVKRSITDLEIIIISGYAHFDYAQSAIKFGVGNYLLKPIDKMELYTTLRKLKERILKRKESETDRMQLLQKSEYDIYRLQMNLTEQLINKRAGEISLERLQTEYYLRMKPGIFQAFWIKIDGREEELSEAGIRIILDKVQSLLHNILQPKCHELLLYKASWACVGIMNYESGKSEEVRRSLRDCFSHLEAQKNMYEPVTFSIALGCGAGEAEKLQTSVQEAAAIIKERLIKGTGRILDRLPQHRVLHEQNLLEKYLRFITHAIEVMSPEEAEIALERVRTGLEEAKHVSGCEVLELAVSCGRLFLSQLELQHREEKIKKFTEQCEQCSSVNELFGRLSALQKEYLEELASKHENDAARPIRQAKQYIQNHFSEQITMEEVSNSVGLSTAYFSVLFKKSEEEGFAKYLTNVRIGEAKRLLRESQLTVAEICRRVGYHDLKHFTHIFEKATGVKPATYRKLYG